MSAQGHSALPEIHLDGSALRPELLAQVASVEVDHRIGLPTAVTVVLLDPDREVLGLLGTPFGRRMEISAAPVGDAPRTPLAQCELVSVDVAYTAQESTVTLRGYDLSHRLHRLRRTRSFQDVTDADVLRTVAGDDGLDVGEVDDPGLVHTHLVQWDQTDWDFLSSRARESGRVLRLREDRLELVRPPRSSAAPESGDLTSEQPLQLVLGEGVQSVHARVSSAELPAEIEVRGWDPDAQDAIVSRRAVTAPGTDIGVTPEELAQGAGAAVLSWSTTPVAGQEEADRLSAALAERLGCGFATSTLVCQGDPALVAGRAVSVGLAGDLVSGRWTATATRHTFDVSGYRTSVQLGGSTELALAAVLPGPSPRSDAAGRGTVPGVVTDITDPEDLGRVRVSLPWLSEDYVSGWTRVVRPEAGTYRGLVLLPEVGDEVLVAFGHGDPRRPFVLGALHSAQQVPPLEAGAVDPDAGVSNRRGLVSRRGHRLVLEDGDRPAGLTLETGSAAVRIRLDAEEDGLELEASGPVMVSGDAVSVSARTIELSGDSEVSVSAPTIALTADGTLTLRGSTVKIN